jgi:ceramide glucosyltransferase
MTSAQTLAMGVPLVLAALTVVGALQVLAGWIAMVRFARRRVSLPADAMPISILKPLHGDEPFLEQALTTLLEQDYPAGFQVIFGVQNSADTALPIVRALRERYPNHDIALVVDPARHGTNPKVGNLINMVSAARHDILVIADADVHAAPDYLRQLAAMLARPDVGLVTSLYVGQPAFHSMAGLLGATQITHNFLPGVLLGREFGRADCLGATMCLRRDTLAQIGGLEALKDHLADDNVLGRLVLARGLNVSLAATVVGTTVSERSLAALWRHELRWARTIRTLEPVAFAASLLQYPLFLATLTMLTAGFAMWACVLALAVWGIRALAATAIDRVLRQMPGRLAFGVPLWLLPIRDVLSAAEWMVSHAGRRVDWRGQTLEADTPPRFTQGSHAR